MKYLRIFLLLHLFSLFLFSQSSLNSKSASNLRTLILGDSHAYSLSGPIEDQKMGMSIVVEGVSSSGLARPDFFNWISWSQNLDLREYDAIFIILGTNDGQNMQGEEAVPFGSLEWEYLYMARVEKLLTTLQGKERNVFWVTIPPVSSESLERKTQYIQALIDEVCVFHGVEKLDVNTLLSRFPPEQGMVRKSDGVHLSSIGSALVVNSILKEIGHIF